jgi:hypothetical protein
MKTSLKFIALALAAGFPIAAFAQFAGASIPAAASIPAVTGLFTAVFVGLMLLKDYSRPSLSLSTKAPVIVPPAGCFDCRADRVAA